MTRTPPPPYTALMLDSTSRALLLSLVPPRHGRVFADHITLAHNPAAPVAGEFKAVARVWGMTSDVMGQAVEVEVDQNAATLLAPGQRPHVTLSCADGVKPEYSKGLPPSTPLGFGIVLTGTVKTIVPK